MRRNNFAWVAMPITALCLTMMAGCSSSDDAIGATTSPFIINATLGENKANTRATVDYGTTDGSKETFNWNANDAFQLMAKAVSTGNNIMNNQSLYHTFTIATNYIDASSNNAQFSNNGATFNPEGDFTYFALYPNNGFTDNNGTDLNYSVAATQTQNGANTNHLKSDMKMYANGAVTSTNVSLSFKHLTAMLRFTVKNATAAACKVKSIKVTASANSVFGTEGRITPNATGYNLDPTIAKQNNAATLTLNMSDYELAAKATVDGYALTLPGDALTDQNLTFTLTVTDADGTNERTYTSLALDADNIIAANNKVTTFEAGKRYWFNLMLDSHQLTANITAVTPWGEGTPSEGENLDMADIGNKELTLADLNNNYSAAQRNTLTAITLNGNSLTFGDVTAYIYDTFKSTFPNVTTVNFTGSTIGVSTESNTNPAFEIFTYDTQVKTINSETLTSLGANAFAGKSLSSGKCSVIENFNLPNVVSVGDYCFNYCGWGLKTLSLPKVTKVGTNSFANNPVLQNVCFASLEDFTTASDIFGYSDIITDLAFGTLNQMTFASEEKKVFGGPMIQGTAANTTLYLNETGYEYQNNVSGSTWRGITFKAIKKYSEYTYKKD